MQLQSEKTCDQSKQSSQEGMQDLKKRIALTNLQLHQLVSNPENFSQRIKQLNRKAIKQINSENYEQALIYLVEAQKNLEYAASCGLSLDRALITTTLKNEACTHQRLWELATCYDYMEALIYNLSNSADEGKNLKMTTDVNDSGSEENKRVSKIMNQKLNIALCYLQFSALSSQLGKHDEARRSVERSLEQFKLLHNFCHSYEKISKGKVSQLLHQIREILEFTPNIKPAKMIKQCKEAMWKIKTYRYFFNFDSTLIERLSMGDIMQINPTSTEQASKLTDADWFVSQLGLTSLSIYISCCYFALATEIRLGIQKDILDEEQINEGIKEAKIYHLHSIKIASDVVLIESSFLNHIVKSFKNNFTIDLLKIQPEEDQIEEISQIEVKENKYETSEKYSKELKNNGVIHKKVQDQGTKGQSTQSEANDHNDKRQIEHEQSNRKISTVQSHASPKSKLIKIPRPSLKQKSKSPITVRTSRSNDGKKLENKSKNKSKTKIVNHPHKKNNILSPQYYNIRQQAKRSRTKESKTLVFPKPKFTRKSESSQSKPKLKMKSIKSPSKL